MQGFFLGLTNGVTCLAFCAPVLAPFLLREGGGVRQNLGALLLFLLGRLGGYMAFALLAWATGSLLLTTASAASAHLQSLLIGAAYVGLAALLLLSALRRREPAACPIQSAQATLSRWPRLDARLLPVGMGLLAGLRLCPPLLLAFTEAARSGALGDSLLLFAAFFVGASIYILPLALLGALKRVPDLRIVGQFAAVIVALYYFASGLLLLGGGVR